MKAPPLAKILIADDEPLCLRTTGDLLRKSGYECVCVPDAHAALNALHNEPFDLVLSDLNMPGNLKLELLQRGRAQWPHTPLIVITGVPSLPSAIESIRLGISDYLLKPVKFEDLLTSVRRALQGRAAEPLAERSDTDRRELASQFPEIIGTSPAMLELFDIADRIAGTDTNVLITGESGTGKEIVARSIHRHSPRNKHSMQVIDCTAIPESLFESILFGHMKGSFTGAIRDQTGLLSRSDRGTAFFDEIGELPAPLQAKLLRVIQEQTFTPVGHDTTVQVDTRFICATNRDLELEVNAGRFRRDLFYRLAVVHIHLPPLRQRGDDIRLLAKHFVQQLRPSSGYKRASRATHFSAEALACLEQYHWPGNIRELRNVVERALALARHPQIEIADLPPALRTMTDVKPSANSSTHNGASDPTGGASLTDTIENAECKYLTALLQVHQGNVSQAATQAGMSRQGLHKLLKKHGIAAADYRL
ncbi:MAG: sigma-54-dependent Fis family transcriptional regulator [Planctomycetales bacterium]|nr:sigma-54-dependent Fis family transcriptional regulator [Planctomycetales bacterium]